MVVLKNGLKWATVFSLCSCVSCVTSVLLATFRGVVVLLNGCGARGKLLRKVPRTVWLALLRALGGSMV